MKKFKKIIALASAVTLIAASFAACGGKEKEVAKDVDPNAPLTYWCTMDGNSSNAGLQSYSDMMLFKEMEKRTGVKVEFIHPIKGSTGSEAFLTVISSKERPDMMEYGWSGYTGGAQKAIEDEVIIALNDYMEEYAPNYYDYMEGEKGKANNYLWKLQATTEDGYYYGFNAVNVGTTRGFAGLYLRADKLKAWGMEVPETIEEWEAVLAKAKAEGFEKPFTCDKNTLGFVGYNSSSFNTAFGVGKGIYLQGDKVVFAPFEKGYKEYVALMADWVKKGYIDTSFPTADSTMITGNMTNDISFASWGYVGSAMGKILPAAKARNPEYDLVACPYPVAEKGQISEFQMTYDEVGSICTAITTSCANPEKAIGWYDYFYGDEGSVLQLFGLEGEHHTVEVDSDGTKHYRYTDLILDPAKSEVNSVGEAMYKYMLPCNHPGLNQHPDYLYGYYPEQSQKDAIITWNIASDNSKKHKLPGTISYTEEESREKTDITEVAEDALTIAITDIMLGKTSIDAYDAAIEAAKANGYDRLIEIEQAAYDRYLSKK